jgi:hypothetical protein
MLVSSVTEEYDHARYDHVHGEVTRKDRFIYQRSPDGTSWLAVYRSTSQDEPVGDHMRNVIFAKDETITYLRGERTWVAVSGIKDSRIFYRKAVLACAGKLLHHIAFEYPVELKTRMDSLVVSASRALDDTRTDCEQSVSDARS